MKAEHANALKDLAHMYKAESSDHATAFQERLVVLDETCLYEKEEVRHLRESVEREQ